MKPPRSVNALERFGRVRLSKTFFMRDFLYSEISQIESIANLPDDPELAIAAGRRLCEEVLEPIQERFGRLAIRSAFRSSAVNAKGAENGNQYNCARNESNRARHIWDVRDSAGHLGAMACVVIPSAVDYYERTGDWQAIAWWVHDHVPGYSEMMFFRRLAAFNVGWHERPKKEIHSWVPRKHCLTRPGMANHGGSHARLYEQLIEEIDGRQPAPAAA